MGATVPSGLRFPAKSDPPDVAGDIRTLAEDVQGEIVRINGDVADHETRLTTIEGHGIPSWVKVDEGTVSGVAGFVIAGITPGAYRAVRLHLFGSASAADIIRMRFNDDNTIALHKFGFRTYDGDGTLQFFGFGDSDFWRIGFWGTAASCAAEVTILNTHISSSCSYRAWSSRIGGSITTHQETTAHGRLNAPRLLTSLRVSGPPGGTISCDWWLEGAPA